MPKIFISYRRDDSAVVAGRIFDRLQAHFGRSSVFMDVDSIPYGTDFRERLTDAVNQCAVLLAIIGGDWLKEEADGRRRLDDSNDFVRIEIKAALDLGIRIVPILVGQTMMPLEEHLPHDLKDFAYRHAAQVDPGKDFHLYMDRIIKKLDQLLAQARTSAPQATASSTGENSVPDAAPNPELEVLVKSVEITQGYSSTDNRGQVFAKLKLTLSNVAAVFAYLESLLSQTDEDLVEKAVSLLIKHSSNLSARAVRQSLMVMQASARSGLRSALARELATLLKGNRATWDADLQDEAAEALKFVAAYDSHHWVRLAAIEAIATLGRSDGTDFLISLVRSKKGIGESTPDWSHAVSILAKLGDVEAARAFAQICSERQTDLDVLQSIVYWVSCHLHYFLRFPSEVKIGMGEGARTILERSEAVLHLAHLDAALKVLISLTPEEALTSILAFLEPGDPASRSALSRSLAAVASQEQTKSFLRRVKQNEDAAQAVMNALQLTADDPDSNEYLKKNAVTAMNLLQAP
jgi:hypothetical protein